VTRYFKFFDYKEVNIVSNMYFRVNYFLMFISSINVISFYYVTMFVK